ncbi:MAG: hypothetical protein LBC72_00385 [Spirochaetaceae bacterium]|nr:hypothetical protein [Spirochaetaceae bacterium]
MWGFALLVLASGCEEVQSPPASPPPPPVPDTPALLYAGDGTLTVRWPAVAGAQRYELSLDGKKPWSRADIYADEDDPSLYTGIVRSLNNENTYHVYVRSISADGTASEWSESIAGKPHAFAVVVLDQYDVQLESFGKLEHAVSYLANAPAGAYKMVIVTDNLTPAAGELAFTDKTLTITSDGRTLRPAADGDGDIWSFYGGVYIISRLTIEGFAEGEKALLTVCSGALTLKEGAVLKGAACAVEVAETASLTLTGGGAGDAAETAGAAIRENVLGIHCKGGSVSASGGASIAANTQDGVLMEGGVFALGGEATLAENARYGADIHFGTMTLTGEAFAGGNGSAAVAVQGLEAALNIEGGSIAQNSGFSVLLRSGALAVSGGEIQQGAVAQENGVLTITGGTLKGGLAVLRGTVAFSAGTIASGGVIVGDDADIALSGTAEITYGVEGNYVSLPPGKQLAINGTLSAAVTAELGPAAGEEDAWFTPDHLLISGDVALTENYRRFKVKRRPNSARWRVNNNGYLQKITEIYVATLENGGSDSNEGSSTESPYLTLGRALSEVDEGSVVKINGVLGAANAGDAASGTSTFTLNNVSITVEGVTLDSGFQAADGKPALQLTGACDVTLSGLVLRGAVGSSEAKELWVTGTSRVLLENTVNIQHGVSYQSDALAASRVSGSVGGAVFVSQGTLEVPGTVSGGVTVSGGTASVGGTVGGQLAVSGTGALAVGGTVAGGCVITGGVVQILAGGSAGGPSTISGGSLEIAAGGALNNTVAVSAAGTVQVEGTLGGAVVSGSTLTVAASGLVTTLVVQGSGAVVVDGGTVSSLNVQGGQAALAGTVTMLAASGGQVRTSAAVSVPAGSVSGGAFAVSHRYSGAISVSGGTVSLEDTVEAAIYSGMVNVSGGQFVMRGAENAIQGGVNVSQSGSAVLTGQVQALTVSGGTTLADGSITAITVSGGTLTTSGDIVSAATNVLSGTFNLRHTHTGTVNVSGGQFTMAAAANVPDGGKIILAAGRTVGLGAEALSVADGSQCIAITDKPAGLATRAVLTGETAALSGNFLKFAIEQAAGEHYGIDSAGFCRAQFASGGSVSYYTSGGAVYEVHTFTNTMMPDVFTFFIPRPLEVLVAGGGGGGGGAFTDLPGGGGGAGGFVLAEIPAPESSYTVSVGAGGAGGMPCGSGVVSQGGAGGDSAFGAYVATGGGGGAAPGGGGDAAAPATDGGSGGGAVSAAADGGAGTLNQGYAGGGATGVDAAGGGGGAGSAGVDASGDTAGTAGGCGVQNAISGTPRWYGCGGPAGVGTDGIPIAENMAAGIAGTYTGAIPYSGNGGAGGNAGLSQGSAGSSGIVVLRFQCR